MRRNARFVGMLGICSAVGWAVGWFGAAALMHGCGLPAGPYESTSEPLTPMTFGTYTATTDSARNYIQQVPFGTQNSDHLSDGFGTFFSYPQQPQGVLSTGLNYGQPFTSPTQGDHVRFNLSAVTTPTDPNITCPVIIGAALRTSTTLLSQWFKAPYPGFSGDLRQSTQGFSPPAPGAFLQCSAAGGSWHHPPYQDVAVYYWPSGPAYTGEPTTSAPSTFSLRMDIDFPEYNVTNRYFYYFVKTGP